MVATHNATAAMTGCNLPNAPLNCGALFVPLTIISETQTDLMLLKRLRRWCWSLGRVC